MPTFSPTPASPCPSRPVHRSWERRPHPDVGLGRRAPAPEFDGLVEQRRVSPTRCRARPSTPRVTRQPSRTPSATRALQRRRSGVGRRRRQARPRQVKVIITGNAQRRNVAPATGRRSTGRGRPRSPSSGGSATSRSRLHEHGLRRGAGRVHGAEGIRRADVNQQRRDRPRSSSTASCSRRGSTSPTARSSDDGLVDTDGNGIPETPFFSLMATSRRPVEPGLDGGAATRLARRSREAERELTEGSDGEGRRNGRLSPLAQAPWSGQFDDPRQP